MRGNFLSLRGWSPCRNPSESRTEWHSVCSNRYPTRTGYKPLWGPYWPLPSEFESFSLGSCVWALMGEREERFFPSLPAPLNSSACWVEEGEKEWRIVDGEAPLNPTSDCTSYTKGLTWILHIMSLGMRRKGRNSWPKWISLPDWQGKCKQRGASPGNNEFGDFPQA